MSRVTLEALGRSIFDCRFSALTDKPEPIVAAYHDAIKVSLAASRSSHSKVGLLTLPFVSQFLSNPILILWPWTKMFYPKLIKSMEQFDEMLHDIIRRKRKEVESAPAGQEMRDLVSTMIQAAMDETEPKITAKELRVSVLC
jgi:cytochrome P450